MLTIQPSLANYNVKTVSFKAGEKTNKSAESVYDEKYYKSKQEYYKQKAAECDELIKDKKAPGFLKKSMKVFKVVAEAMCDAIGVAWGAVVGAKFIKSSVIKGVDSKFAKGAKKVVRPLTEGISSLSGKFVKFAKGLVEDLKATKFMKETNTGKFLTDVIDAISSGIKYVSEKVKSPFKGKTTEEIYDKTTKTVSTTLGVGAGVAGAYNAATGADKNSSEKEAAIGADNQDVSEDVPEEEEFEEDKHFHDEGEV